MPIRRTSNDFGGNGPFSAIKCAKARPDSAHATPPPVTRRRLFGPPRRGLQLPTVIYHNRYACALLAEINKAYGEKNPGWAAKKAEAASRRGSGSGQPKPRAKKKNVAGTAPARRSGRNTSDAATGNEGVVEMPDAPPDDEIPVVPPQASPRPTPRPTLRPLEQPSETPQHPPPPPPQHPPPPPPLPPPPPHHPVIGAPPMSAGAASWVGGNAKGSSSGGNSGGEGSSSGGHHEGERRDTAGRALGRRPLVVTGGSTGDGPLDNLHWGKLQVSLDTKEYTEWIQKLPGRMHTLCCAPSKKGMIHWLLQRPTTYLYTVFYVTEYIVTIS
ncbi:hypothetical protein B0H16DRAFT_1467510 [Mycena metata]|uniref:Uncharacterized protein n=1 Tax=Mycena metata TaxID=1033252 RepID=A0AAD7MVN0_9AGAR|nr:hypothetical protein B0H16DRAFT_1467510 [Mycena metata]